MKPEKYSSFSGRLILVLLSLTWFYSRFCFSSDTITSKKFIKDPATIISVGSTFELGFFTPVNSTRRYVGIWFKQVSLKTVVWVANKDKPLNNTSGIFTISEDGNLVVLDSNNTILWSSNVSSSSSSSGSNVSRARILDSGNLVLEDTASGGIIWESFNHPSDKLWTSMKFITNTRTKEKVGLTSWNSPSDPSTGNFVLTFEVENIPEVMVWNNELKLNPYWRSGPWNGQVFLGMAPFNSILLFQSNFVIRDETYFFSLNFYYNYTIQQLAYLSLSSQGKVERKDWDFEEEKWKVLWSPMQTQCDYYGVCGRYGICDAKNTPICSCIRGFQPKQEHEWNRGIWSGGCVRNTPLNCQNPNNTTSVTQQLDGFLKIEMVKLPSFAKRVNSSTSQDDCRRECFNNCSCTAYAFESGIGCMLWSNHLVDIQKLEIGGTDIHILMAYADLHSNESAKHKKGVIIIIIIAIVLPVILTLFIIAISFWFRRRGKSSTTQKATNLHNEKRNMGSILKLKRDDLIGEEIKLEELPLYDFEELAMATNNFDISNKLGQGGFGPVYKGKLLNGQDIAVKRLSRASNQGYEEFINEVRVISKLQHRNLVRLLGCSIEGEEKMLIYEYMPNSSLDALIFDSSKKKHLDWRKRFNIIDGIARGLLYLHRDSRLRIIHRDLKVSNILLDKDWNPKISDFGMARIFYGDQVQANTSKVAGTYGYMSPEYAMKGQFSEKSDVFSFGVLLLEIISGRRNSEFDHHELTLSLLELAWKLWKENNLIALIDQTIYELCCESEILRCIHVGLLCVEESIDDRPNVFTIISMLNSAMVDLPVPKQPSFIGRQAQSNTKCLNEYSAHRLTFTSVVGR